MATKKDKLTQKILTLYFKGLGQIAIGKYCNTSQSTVSRCIAKFADKAELKGLDKAAQEVGIMQEIDELRGLAIALHKKDIDVAVAKAGAKMVTIFDNLDVVPDDYPLLAKAFSEVKKPGFVEAAVKLAALEASTGKEHAKAIAEYEELNKKTEEIKSNLEALEADRKNEELVLIEAQKKRKDKEIEYDQFVKETEAQKAKIQADLDDVLKTADLVKEQLATVHNVVDAAHQQGIKDKDLVAYIQERLQLEGLGLSGEAFTSVTKALAQAGELDSEVLEGNLQQYGGLQKSVHALTEAKTLLQEEVKTLSKNKLKLEKDLKELETHIDGASTTNEHLEKEWHDLNAVVARLMEEKNTLEKELPGLQKETVERTGQLARIELQIFGASDKLLDLNQKVADSEAKIKAAGNDYMIFEALMDTVKQAEGSWPPNPAEGLGAIYKTARVVAEDPGAFLAGLVSKQTGDPINVVECNNCGARLIIVKQGKVDQQSIHSFMKCPDCGELELNIVETIISAGGKAGEIITVKPVQKPDTNEGMAD